jgi:aminopeptidase N
MTARSSSWPAIALRGLGVTALGLLAGGLLGCGAPRAPAAEASPKPALVLPAPAPRKPALLLPGKESSAGSYDVLDYDASLQIIPETSDISGLVRISVKVRAASPSLDFAAEDLVIDGVREGGQDRRHESVGGRLRIPLEGAAPGATRTLEIAYHGHPTVGLRFGKDATFTIFNTGRWLPCSDVPGDKATLTLRLTAPAGLTVVASGDPVRSEPVPGGLERHTFRLGIPHSAYLFGFAAGKFHELTRTVGEVSLRFLSTERSDADLQRIFAGTEEMLRFFEARAGVRYPFSSYTQVLAHGASPQELASLALLPSDYADEVLIEPREDWAVAHELAHTWWGNLVTCTEWSDFWMNEAFATFMTAAYKEHRWGRDEYDREMVLARRRFQRIRERGADRALALTGRVGPKDVEGPISYAKGSAVLNLLRHQLGEAAFWAGVKAFVRDNAGGAVSTDALEAAMEASSGQQLDAFFRQWIRGPGVPDVVVRHREEGASVVFEIEQIQPTPWSFPLQLGVETSSGRKSQTVLITERRQEARIPLEGALLSARVDDGGYLPFVVRHERSTAMLLHQLGREPDVSGRADALERLVDLCRSAQGCGGAREALVERAKADPSRLVRKLATDALTQSPPFLGNDVIRR